MTILYSLLAYLFIINGYGFWMMGRDKRKAQKKQWRTKERTLLTIALIGGALGIGGGMSFFRHKTKTPIFQILVPIYLILNIVAIYFIMKYL